MRIHIKNILKYRNITQCYKLLILPSIAGHQTDHYPLQFLHHKLVILPSRIAGHQTDHYPLQFLHPTWGTKTSPPLDLARRPTRTR
jgi:hypothetical protein